ncbi:MAG: hypothetical protein IJ091_08825 [Oscillospiraceae bacterium]|nr:hypothetical protein [Oscillospiraceae bacterium]
MKNPHVLLDAMKDEKKIAAAESLRRVDEKGYLYYMESDWDYYDIPEVFMPIFDTGCSTFFVKNLEGEPMMYRNYDYRHYYHGDKNGELTALGVVVRSSNPKAKYKSIGVADAFWLDRVKQEMVEGTLDDGKTDVSALVLTPYICMDGMNEAGLTTSIMALTVDSKWTEMDYDVAVETIKTNGKENYEHDEPGFVPGPKEKRTEIGTIVVNHADKKAWVCSKELPAQKNEGKPTTIHTILMRMMLDYCGTVEEAIGLTLKYNVKSAIPGSAFHLLVGDATGKSVVLEFVGDETKIRETDHCTNYYLSFDDGYRDKDRRYECLEVGLERFHSGIREDFGTTLMALVAQDPKNGADRGKTLTSSVYNTLQKTLKVYAFGDFSQSYDFKL